MRRILRDDLPRHKPVKPVPDRGEPLLDSWCGMDVRQVRDVSADMQGRHVGNGREAMVFAPVAEFPDRPCIGAARVCVADVDGEEFEKAQNGALAPGGDEGGRAGNQ